MLGRAREALPELPAQRAERLERELGLPPDSARLLAFRTEWGDFFEAAVDAAEDGKNTQAIAHWITNDLRSRLGEADPADSKVEPEALAALVGLVSGGTVAQAAARTVLDTLVEEGGDPRAIVEAKGLGLAGGDELEDAVDRAIAANPDAVEKIRQGNDRAIGALVGPVMKEMKGRADGGEVQRLIRERIGD
jgi:aspartyl-tRNA(Asn)/glutamyl-tRNA(Gln) amidotransferase subunit B